MRGARSLALMPRRWRIAAYAVVGLAAAAAVIPFLYVLSASLKNQRSLFSYPPDLLPSPIEFDNFARLFADHPFLRWTANTLFVAGTVTLAKLVIDSLAAYALATLDFVGKRLILWAMLSTFLVPIGVLIIPLYFMFRELQLLDTYWALILPPLASPVGIFMLRAFILQLPPGLEQAARADGCNPFQSFWHVILPLIKPGLVVVGMYQFAVQYTSFVWPVIAVDDPDLLVLTTGLASLNPVFFLRDWGLISAGMILTMLPITLIFLVFQRQFLSVSLAGALKE